MFLSLNISEVWYLNPHDDFDTGESLVLKETATRKHHMTETGQYIYTQFWEMVSGM